MMDYDITHGRTYMYFKEKPLYPFGYGLSYTRFNYSGTALNDRVIERGDTLRVCFNLKILAIWMVMRLYNFTFPHENIRTKILSSN